MQDVLPFNLQVSQPGNPFNLSSMILNQKSSKRVPCEDEKKGEVIRWEGSFEINKLLVSIFPFFRHNRTTDRTCVLCDPINLIISLISSTQPWHRMDYGLERSLLLCCILFLSSPSAITIIRHRYLSRFASSLLYRAN